MIGVFDSGLGGITILKRLLELLPNEDYYYYSDSKHNPYGEKEEEEINHYVDEIVNQLLTKGCKAIVIACNTASTVSIRYLRNKYPETLFLPTVPAIKLAHDQAYQKKTLVMATRRTLESDLWRDLYQTYHPVDTSLLACDGLAKLIEDGKQVEMIEYLHHHLISYRNIESVVLGCTHYPLIKEELRHILGDVTFYDGGVGISRELKRQLEEREWLKETNKKGKITFYDSSCCVEKENRFWELLNHFD